MFYWNLSLSVSFFFWPLSTFHPWSFQSLSVLKVFGSMSGQRDTSAWSRAISMCQWAVEFLWDLSINKRSHWRIISSSVHGMQRMGESPQFVPLLFYHYIPDTSFFYKPRRSFNNICGFYQILLKKRKPWQTFWSIWLTTYSFPAC